ncbi:MAG: SMP-30/gluconolactonase/LRE family protein [Armatimonadota bacterium]
MFIFCILASLCNTTSAGEIAALVPDAFGKLISPDAKVEKVAGGFNFTEGPVWSKEGYLVFSDIPANMIRKVDQNGKVSTINDRSGHANGLTFDLEGRLIACEHGNRRVTRVELDGSMTVLADKYNGRRFNSPNDVVVKSDGSIYFTDPPYGVRPEDREMQYQGIYRINSNGKIKLLVKDMKCPNGLAFSPDEKILYVADSSERLHVKAFDVNPDGTLSNGRIFANLKTGVEGPPDGMKVDKAGNLWTTGPGGVWVFNKEGVLLGTIKFPQITANCAWGDEDGTTLYAASTTAVYRIKTNAKGIRPWMKTESESNAKSAE